MMNTDNLEKVMKYSWNLNLLFDSYNDPAIDLELENLLKGSSEFRDKWHLYFAENTKYCLDSVLESILDYEAYISKFGITKAELYAALFLELNQNSNEAKLLDKKVEATREKANNNTIFYLLAISRLPKEVQIQILNSSAFAKWKHFLKRCFTEGEHLLSEKEEKILNMKESTSRTNWIKLTTELIDNEEMISLDELNQEVKMPFNTLLSLTTSTNKSARELAIKNVVQVLEKHSSIATAELNSILQDKASTDELRNFQFVDQERVLDDDLEKEIVDTLIQVVSENFDISQKFYKLKSELLGKEKLEYPEKSIPISTVADETYDYTEACRIVRKVFDNLDSEFTEIFDDFLDSSRIDVYPKKGKGGGAFCMTTTPSLPIWIMLNYTGKQRDILTIAHEMGHGINGTFTNRKYADDPLNASHSTCTAEVASTFFEDFVLEEMKSTQKPEELLSLKFRRLDDEVSTIFRQIACYKFELELNETFRRTKYLSNEDIGSIFKEHMKSYLGESVNLEGYENFWIHWSHIRMHFYVYSYAFGLLVSKILQAKVREDRQNIQMIKEFLSAGSDRSPSQILLGLGIDLRDKATWAVGLKQIRADVESIEL